jgi:hypothetical protein
LTDAPSEVDPKQLEELNLRTQRHLRAIEQPAEPAAGQGPDAALGEK